MNLKQLGILISLVIVIGAAGLVIHNHQKSDWSGGGAEVGKKLLGTNFLFNDVAHISIKHGTNELNLVKKDDLWRVRERGNYPANFSQISEFLLKARDLKIVQIEEVGASQLGRLELSRGQGSNSAVVVQLDDQTEKPIRTLLLGKKHMRKSATPSQFEGEDGFADGRYVAVGTNTHQVALDPRTRSKQLTPTRINGLTRISSASKNQNQLKSIFPWQRIPGISRVKPRAAIGPWPTRTPAKNSMLQKSPV